MKKTLLIGSFGAQNIGDELILQSALQKYKKCIVCTANAHYSQQFSSQTFTTLPPFPAGFKSLIQFLFSPKKWQTYLQRKNQIKRVVFPGGGLFKNNAKAVIIWSITVWWVKFFYPNTNIYFEAQGVDVPHNRILQKLVKWSFNQAKSVSVRDTISKQNLQQIGYTKKIVVVPDAAHNFLQNQNIFTTHKQPQTPRILIQAAKNFNAEKTRQKIAKRFPNIPITFIAFDALDQKIIHKNTNIPIKKILFPRTYDELLNVFNNHHIFIGQRFHFLIVSYLKNPHRTFLLHKPYAPKTKTLAQTLNIKKF